MTDTPCPNCTEDEMCSACHKERMKELLKDPHVQKALGR